MYLINLVSILLLCLALPLHAQKLSENLVPNHSFEDIKDCDLYFEEFDKVADWKSYNFTPDIFHVCSKTAFLSVPRNIFGFQFPAHGRGYAGIMTYHVEYPNEVIGVKLNTPLEIGKNYRLTFKVSRAKLHAAYASDNMGLLLTNEPEKAVYAGKAHLLMEAIVTDSEQWTTITGVVKADLAYQYLMLGNFFGADYTHLQQMPEGKFETAYYFVDEVSIFPTTDAPTPVNLPKRITANTFADKVDTVTHTTTQTSYSLSGKVIDAVSQEPISSKIELIIPQTAVKDYIETHYLDGMYAFTGIKSPNRFTLKVTARNYYPQTLLVHISEEEPRAKKTIYLQPLRAGMNLYLKSVEFEGGTDQLVPEAVEELYHFAQVMRDNPLMEIELQSYTDTPDGTALAQQRAKVVQDYVAIVGKVDRRRMKIAAIYQTANHTSVDNATEEQRKPERIEFKVLN